MVRNVGNLAAIQRRFRRLARGVGRELPSDKDLSPIFLLGFHRGGTTFVQRVLNTSRNLVLWGEHGGILKHYMEAHSKISSAPIQTMPLRAYRKFDEYAERWIPWANQFDLDSYEASLQQHLIELFGLAGSDCRWGFKEIFYNEVEDAEFLLRLFPQGRIIYLQRNPEHIFLSQYFVRWNTKAREEGAETFAKEFVDEFRRDSENQEAVAARFENARVFRVEELADVASIRELADFVGLPWGGFDLGLLQRSMSVRIGSTFAKGIDNDVEDVRNLIRDCLREAGLVYAPAT